MFLLGAAAHLTPQAAARDAGLPTVTLTDAPRHLRKAARRGLLVRPDGVIAAVGVGPTVPLALATGAMVG